MVHTRGRLCDHGITVPECPVSSWEFRSGAGSCGWWRGLAGVSSRLGSCRFQKNRPDLGREERVDLGVARC